MPFGKRSFYLQPWRSYQDTFPATRMLDAAGVNFNIYNGNTYQISAGAKLLHDAGFTHARIEIPWNTMDYQNPGQLTAQRAGDLNPILQQLKANGIRPLILLNSNDGIPCPVQSVTLNVTAAAAAGATQVQLDSASAALVKPGYTGLQAVRTRRRRDHHLGRQLRLGHPLAAAADRDRGRSPERDDPEVPAVLPRLQHGRQRQRQHRRDDERLAAVRGRGHADGEEHPRRRQLRRGGLERAQLRIGLPQRGQLLQARTARMGPAHPSAPARDGQLHPRSVEWAARRRHRRRLHEPEPVHRRRRRDSRGDGDRQAPLRKRDPVPVPGDVQQRPAARRARQRGGHAGQRAMARHVHPNVHGIASRVLPHGHPDRDGHARPRAVRQQLRRQHARPRRCSRGRHGARRVGHRGQRGRVDGP